MISNCLVDGRAIDCETALRVAYSKADGGANDGDRSREVTYMHDRRRMRTTAHASSSAHLIASTCITITIGSPHDADQYKNGKPDQGYPRVASQFSGLIVMMMESCSSMCTRCRSTMSTNSSSDWLTFRAVSAVFSTLLSTSGESICRRVFARREDTWIL